MTDTFELDGEEYEMTGDPSLGTVREVQSMQNKMLLGYVDEDRLREMDGIDDEREIIDAILDSGGMDALQDVQWERSMLLPIQTISLACDETFSTDDFDGFSALNFKEARENAEDVLGGDANDFFETLGIGINLTEEEMNRAT